jgi:hypothetical protein
MSLALAGEPDGSQADRDLFRTALENQAPHLAKRPASLHKLIVFHILRVASCSSSFPGRVSRPTHLSPRWAAATAPHGASSASRFRFHQRAARTSTAHHLPPSARAKDCGAPSVSFLPLCLYVSFCAPGVTLFLRRGGATQGVRPRGSDQGRAKQATLNQTFRQTVRRTHCFRGRFFGPKMAF